MLVLPMKQNLMGVTTKTDSKRAMAMVVVTA